MDLCVLADRQLPALMIAVFTDVNIRQPASVLSYMYTLVLCIYWLKPISSNLNKTQVTNFLEQSYTIYAFSLVI